jgi:hypothetical protein
MLRTAIITALFLSSLGLSAQDSTKVKHIRQLMELTGMAKLGNQMMTNIISSYKQNFPAATTEFWDAFMKEADMSQLFEKVIPVYEQNFTDDAADHLLPVTRRQKNDRKNARHHAGVDADRLRMGETAQREGDREAEAEGVYQEFVSVHFESIIVGLYYQYQYYDKQEVLLHSKE